MSLISARSGGQYLGRHAARLWQRSPLGRRYLAAEERELRRVIPEVFGRHLLQVGSWGQGDRLVRCAETLHHATLGTVSGLGAQALVRADALPVRSGCVDAVLLPHTLEFTPTPHAVLREADRVLSDRGRLFILGFSPLGAWVLRERLGWRYRGFPAGGHFHRVGRVADWLELLDYEVSEVRRFGVGFPWIRPHSVAPGPAWSKLWSWLAGSYLLVARKRVTPLNRLQAPASALRWAGSPALPALGARRQINRPESPEEVS